MGFGLHLIPAHSVVALAEKFAERIRLRADPFLPETVLIMNYAQKIWLQRFLAEKNGICANIRFLSPEAFLEERIFQDERKRFSREPLAWRIFAALKKTAAEDAGTPPEFLFELSRKPEEEFFRRAVELSDLFWRYQNFRPRMIRDWMRGAPEPRGADADFLQEYRRQKNLWTQLAFGDALPPAEAWLRLLENAAPIAGAPERIFAFAPSALPRLHVELLEKLAESSDVFLYYHNLSRDLWTESQEAKKRLRTRKRGNADDAGADSDFSGNELLAAWGKAARPLAERLIDAGTLDSDSTIDAPPERDSILHALQREIRDNAAAPAPFVPAESDRSLRIAAAPNPLREMEILRNELTARFAADPALKPRDVLVSLPDLETYTPFIRAAFENSGIPFSVADRSGTEIFPAAAAFLEILRVARGEFRIDEVLALLDVEIIRRSLDLSEEEILPLRETLGDAGIRWGLDAEFRRERIFGKNPQTENDMRGKAETLAANNSWEFGMRRLALGFMCGNDGGDESPIAFGESRVSPVADLTEDASEAFGKIFRLLKILAELNRAFADETPQSVPAWCDFLQTLLADDLLDAGDGEADVLRAALAATKQAAADGLRGFGEENETAETCRFRTFSAALEMRDWSESGRGSGMLRGKVTFCRMQPLRNIPAKIICIAGLSDGAFPRAAARSRRDLLSFRPQNFPAGEAHWDRSPRDDDCLLFLESILAAQDALLLSYVARSSGDGQIVPPCVPLAKLRDFLLEMLPEEPQELGAPVFETLHRLHGFSPEYFSGDAERSRKFFSFSRSDYATARRGGNSGNDDADRDAEESGIFRVLPKSVPEEISMRELAQFFISPAKFICGRRLGIAPKSVPARPENEDPQELFSALDVSRLHRFFFENRLAERERGECAPAAAADEPEIFRARELAAGRTPALAEDGKFEEALAKELKDAEHFSAFLPNRIFRVPDEEIPAEFMSEISGATLRVSLKFERLFRDEAGTLFLALAGKKRFDWRVAAECFVCAQMLAAAFPQDAFVAAYFAYGEKTSLRITDASLRRSRMTPQELLEFFAEKISAPPFLFEKTPLVSEKIDEDEFFSRTRKEWLSAERDVCEEFVFGGNAPDDFEENIRGCAFPFVRAVCAAFESDPENSPEKRRAKR